MTDTSTSALEALALREPRAFVIRYPNGMENVLDAKKWDPRKPEFWISDEAQAQHEVIPLFYATKEAE